MKTNITGTTAIVIDTTAPIVWQALITPAIIKQYFFGTEAVSDWKAGSPIYFKGEWEGKKYQDKGTILEVDPGKLFRYNYWSSISGIEDKPENYVIVSYILEEEEQDKTMLTITQENIADEKTKAHSEQNWKKVLQDLKQLLEK